MLTTGLKASQQLDEGDARVPCRRCIENGRDCSHGHDQQLESAWATVRPAAVQRWAESVQLVPGIEGGVRLRPKRDAAGRVEAFTRETMVKRDPATRLVPNTSKARLRFPATIDTTNEMEEVDLRGDPVRMEADGPLLQALHDALPREPVHPAVFLNAALRDRPALGSSRILSSYEPSLPNLGNVAASAYFRSSEDGNLQSGSVWRSAESGGGRPTAVGWGSFVPTPTDARPRSRKGKERAVDELDVQANGASSPFVQCEEAILHTTTSPIQQLQLASLVEPSQLLLACRSFTSLDLLHIDTSRLSTGEIAIPATVSYFSYSGAQLDRRPIADCALGGVAAGYGPVGSGLVVDTDGALFGFGLDGNGSSRAGEQAWSGRQPQMFRLRRRRRTRGVAGETSAMARVTWAGLRGTDAAVALEDEVLLYDLRSPTSSLALVDDAVLAAHPPFHDLSPAKVTSLLSRSPTLPGSLHPPAPHTTIHVVCTTRDVLWLDERMPGRDVLRWKHGRVGIEGKGSDTTLSLLELPQLYASFSEKEAAHMSASSAHVQQIALHSRLHPQIDILTSELEAACSPRTLIEPYSIPSPYRIRTAADTPFSRSGLSFVHCVAGSGTMPAVGSQGQSTMDAEDAMLRFGLEQDGQSSPIAGGPTPPTCHMLEVGIAGQVYDRELLPASRAGTIEEDTLDGVSDAARPTAEQRIELLPSGSEPARAPVARAFGAVRSATARKTVDVTALGAALRATAASQLDVPPPDERQNVEVDRDDLVKRATRVFHSASGEPGGDTVAVNLLELAALAEHTVEHDRTTVDKPLPLTAGVGAIHTAGVADQLRAPLARTAPAVLELTPKDPPTAFDALIWSSSANEPRQDRAVSDIIGAARTILLPREVEPDEPTLAPNQPQPVDQDPPPIHFAYLRPRAEDSDDDEDDELVPEGGRRRDKRLRKRKGPKPSLDAVGARLLLAEWHIGADPRSYAWHNPYEGEKNKSVYLEASQASGTSRKARKKRDGTVSFDHPSQPSSSAAHPPAFLPSSSFPGSSQAYFPSLALPSTPARPPTSQFEPRLPAPSSQDWTKAASTQPAISVTAPLDSPARAAPPFAGSASQIVPGAFGSRLSAAGHGARDKKKGKKRVSGF
ncbi:hypothetical protein JCM3774_004838 [Rhodotorula dairenensis]